jgi:rhombotail lipoprotein
MKFFMSKSSLVLLTAGIALAFTGCAVFQEDLAGPRQKRRATSLVDYLYPGDTQHTDQPSVPVLALPLRVGVAFVPESNIGRRGVYLPSPALDESRKQKLMEEVAGHFRSLPWVSHIEIIPTSYLSPQGGFANLEQLNRMFNVEVIALLSYDQAQFTDQSRWSIAYWTIVGAYLIEGERNDTRTLLDCALYDIASRRLLFRAPGVSKIKGSSTPINESAELRRDSEHGFKLASTNLVANLDEELNRFRKRVKEAPEEIKVVAKPGFDMGAASFDGISALGLLALACLGFRLKKRCV